MQLDNCEHHVKALFADPKHHLEDLDLALPTVDHNMMLLLAPSVQKICRMYVFVNKVDCDGLFRLFAACPIVEDVLFSVSEFHSVENALKCVKNLIIVAWTKKNLKELVICFEEEGGWDSADTERLVLKMRLKRCRVEIRHAMVSHKTYFE